MAGDVRSTGAARPGPDGEAGHLVRFPHPRLPVDGPPTRVQRRPRPFVACLGPVGVALAEAAQHHPMPVANRPDAVQNAEAAVDVLLDTVRTPPPALPHAARTVCRLAVDRMPWPEILALVPAPATRPTGAGILAVLDDPPSVRRILDTAHAHLVGLRERLPDPDALRAVGTLAVVAAVTFFAEGPLGADPDAEGPLRCCLTSLIADGAQPGVRGAGTGTAPPPAPADPDDLRARLADGLDACERTPVTDPVLGAMRRAHAYAVGYRLRLALTRAPAPGRRAEVVDRALRALETRSPLTPFARRLRPRWYLRQPRPWSG